MRARTTVAGLTSLLCLLMLLPGAGSASAVTPAAATVAPVQGFQVEFVRWDAGRNVYHLTWWGRDDAVAGFDIGYLEGSRDVALPRDQVTQVGGDAQSVDVTVHGDGEFAIRAFRGAPTEASALTTASGVADSLNTGAFGLQAYPYRGTASTILVQRALPIWPGHHVVVRRSPDAAALTTPQSGQPVGPLSQDGEVADDIGPARTMAYRMFEVVDADPGQWAAGEVVSTVASPLPVEDLRLTTTGEDPTRLVASWRRPPGCGPAAQEELGCGTVQVQLREGATPPQAPGEGDSLAYPTAGTSMTFSGLTAGRTYSVSAWTVYGPGRFEGALSVRRSTTSPLRVAATVGWWASPARTITYGQSTTLHGVVRLVHQATPAPGVPVSLQRRSGVATATAATASTDAVGRASFLIRPVSSGQYRVAAAGTPALSPAASSWATVVVRASVGAAASAATVQPGQVFGVSGVVGPRASGPVVLQRKAGTVWQNVARSTSSSVGGYRFSTRWARMESVQYRVVRPADATHATGVSGTVAVEVSPIRFGRIRYDAPGRDRNTATSVNKEYVTVTNAGPVARSLTGWTVQDAARHTYRFRGLTLRPGRSVVLLTGRGADSAGVRHWGLRSHVWNNAGDEAALRAADGRLVDSCSWTSRGTGTTAC